MARCKHPNARLRQYYEAAHSWYFSSGEIVIDFTARMGFPTNNWNVSCPDCELNLNFTKNSKYKPKWLESLVKAALASGM